MARYSPIGFSYKDRMQRVFEGVPLLYGFSSVGPSGKHIKPSLARYLDQIGDYEKHLDAVANGYRDTRTFYRNMRAYTTATSAGIAPNDPNISVKTNSCKLTNDSIPIDQRVAHAGDLLASSPHIYFPTVADFVKHHFSHNALYDEPNGSTRNNLVRITARTELKDQILKIADLGGFGPSLQLDLLSFARTVRWLNGEELETRVRTVLKGLLEKPTLQNSDTFCSIENEYYDLLENIDFNRSNLPNNFDFQSIYALKMLGCLKTKDESLTRLALDSARNLDIQNKTIEIQFGLYSALAKLPGLEDEITEFFLSRPPFQGRLAAEANNSIKGLILKKTKGPRQAELYKKYRSEAKKEEEREVLDYFLRGNKHLTLESEALIMGFEYQACLRKKEDCYFTSVTWRSEIQDWISRYIDLSLNSPWGESLLNSRQYTDSHTVSATKTSARLNEKLVEALVNSSLRQADSNTMSQLSNKVWLYTAAIANGPLGDQQVKKLAVFYRSLPSTSDFAKPYILHILAQNRDQLDIEDQALLAEPKAHYLCKRTGRYRWNCMANRY